jgi:maltooligosyltrehalose trehalohydrolase
VAELACEVLAIRAQSDAEDWLLLCDLRGGHEGTLSGEPFCILESSRRWRPVFSSNAAHFGGPKSQSYDSTSSRIAFQHPEVLVLRAE